MPNKIDRINHLIALSHHYRDQLAAMADEFCVLHNANPGSSDKDDLTRVILDGEDYRTTMLAIRHRHVKRKR